MIKYLIIAVLVSIVFVLVYSRIRPYLKLARNVVESMTGATDLSATTASQPKTPSKNKLVRCDRCGTWIPAERALNLSSGLAKFCSSECMAKEPTSKERKIAS